MAQWRIIRGVPPRELYGGDVVAMLEAESGNAAIEEYAQSTSRDFRRVNNDRIQIVGDEPYTIGFLRSDRDWPNSGNAEAERNEGRLFGSVSDVPVGATFADRRALAESRVHRPIQAGISGSEREGADSVVMSGGYEDDDDYGDVIIYTGQGGQENGVQVADQEWSRGNLALVKSEIEGLPVRVVRGAAGEASFSPASGYRYDGLYYVERSWREPGRSGFQVCRFLLRRLKEDGTPAPSPPDYLDPPVGEAGPAPGVEATVQRLVRSTRVAQHVKALHRHVCQICGEVVTVAGGPYAEGAHIRPLGRPHDGPDVPGNVLCLCPNDHVRFDLGGIVIDEDLQVRDGATHELLSPLRTVTGHQVDTDQLDYHRSRFAGDAGDGA